MFKGGGGKLGVSQVGSAGGMWYQPGWYGENNE